MQWLPSILRNRHVRGERLGRYLSAGLEAAPEKVASAILEASMEMVRVRERIREETIQEEIARRGESRDVVEARYRALCDWPRERHIESRFARSPFIPSAILEWMAAHPNEAVRDAAEKIKPIVLVDP